MTPCLRSSTNIVRASRRTIDIASRSRISSPSPSFRPIAAAVPLCTRSYATQPGGSQDAKKRSNSKETQRQNHGSTKASSEGSNKPAPGMEHMYSKSSALSSKSGETKTSNKSSTSPSSRLSTEDEQTIDELMSILKQSMPAKELEDLPLTKMALREEGVPEDLREVLDNFRQEGSFDLGTAAKIIRIKNRLSRRGDEIQRAQVKGEQQEPQQKTGQHDPGPQSEKDKKKESSGSDFFGGQGSFKDIKWDWNTVVISAFLSYLTYRSLVPSENSRDITWQEFRTQFLDRGLVEKLTVINRNKVKVQLNREAVKSVYPDSPARHANFYYYFTIGDVSSFERHLDEAHNELQIPSSQKIPVSYDDETPWGAVILSYGPTLLLIGATYWLIRRSSGGAGGGSGGGIFNIGKSKAKRYNHETDVKVTFKDVAGMDEAKQEIVEFVSFLKEPGMYQKLGAKIPRGAILSGPPGTGKTLLAKATAGESQVPFFSVSGSEFVEMFVGVGASRVRDLFQNARKSTPCIIFIDEIDAIGKARGKNAMGGGGNDEREATLNQILTEMDGFNTSEQVVVLAGTNRADVLDKALMRPGRFDRHISIDKPTMEGRKQIFAVHLKKIVTKEDLDHLYGRLAALTPGFSGADIANCVNEAALIAARSSAESVNMVHFEQAIERVIGGLEKKSLILNPEEKRTVAYHEAGHAICGWYFKYADPLLKVSIIPRGQGALGYAQYLPNGDSYLLNVHQLMDRMAMTLAGRVSEELHFDTVTSGASDDFNKVTRMATAMVTKWGMSSKVGYMYFEDDPQQQLHKPFSEETAKNIDQEVRRIVDEAYKQCKDLLVEKKKEIGIVAEELLAKEVLSRDDLIRLLGPRPFEDNKDFAKYFGDKGDREGVPGSTPEGSKPDGGSDTDAGPGGVVGPAPTIFRSGKDVD